MIVDTSKYRSWSLLTDYVYDHNRFKFWVVLDSISTHEISVMVVIGRLRPRPILILGHNRFYLSTPRNIGPGRYLLIPTTTDSNSGSLSILSLPQNIGCGRYRLVTIQTDFNSGSNSTLSTCKISVVVVINRLRPRSIPILGRNRSITTTTDYDPVYNYYDLEWYWVVI